MDNGVLGLIDSPQDLKGLSIKQLKALSGEIRERIYSVVSKNGGHLASNLGAVEFTVALHRVFDTPADSIVWDVGHQSYTHKILTGRNSDFDSIRKSGGLSGFPKISESEFDCFGTGHATTSISSALGILHAKKLKGDNSKVIAVIGDGSLTGGMAFEALNHTGYLSDNLIIVLNDNKMSIEENVGALAGNRNYNAVSSFISRLSTTSVYRAYKSFIDFSLKKVPFIGSFLFGIRKRFKNVLKALFLKENLFNNLGCDYVGPINGHNYRQLIRVFKNVKKFKGPVVVHLYTVKGKGFDLAESNPASYHGVAPSSAVVDGKVEKVKPLKYTQVFGEKIVEMAENNDKILAVTAAMTSGTGLTLFSRTFPDRFFDVGIAEAHAVTFSAGLASRGFVPVVSIYSTFMQRAVDQVIHDVALQNLGVVFVMDRAGLVPDDGETHQGLFDISIFKNIPNCMFLAPSTKEVFEKMLDFAVGVGSPVFLRIAKDYCPDIEFELGDLVVGRGSFVIKSKSQKKSENLLINVGSLFEISYNAVKEIQIEGGSCDLYDLLFISPIDEKHFISVVSDYKNITIVEDAIKSGGIAEYLKSLILSASLDIKVNILACDSKFPSHASRDELLKESGLDSKAIIQSFLE